MSRRWTLALLALAALLAWRAWPAPHPGASAREVAAAPRIWPALDGVTLPPNLAAPTFRVDEPGTAWHTEARGARGGSLSFGARRPVIAFPLRAWHALCAANRGGRLTITVSARGRDGQWTRFRPVTVDIANEPIDRYLVYRWLTPLYSLYRNVGVYQRDLTGYRQREVLSGRQYSQGCVNCHTFAANGTQQFTLGFRSNRYGNGTLVVRDGRVRRLSQPVGFGTWHPSGTFIIWSMNQIQQFQHWAGAETRDVVDLGSHLVRYDPAQDRFTAVPQLADPKAMESYPCWSPDGRWLYYSRAPKLWRDSDAFPPQAYAQVRYSLMRIAYDPAAGAWGRPETVRDGERARRSFVFPRVSPDGRWLLATACDYSCFPINRPDSDLVLIDLTTGRDVPLAINSPRAESWHAWSANGRWIVFTSKREDDLFNKVYLSYLDRGGVAHRPVLLPQRDPGCYDKLWYSYNVPELIDTPIPVSAAAFGRAVRETPAPKPKLPPEVVPPPPADPSRAYQSREGNAR